jgi:arylsulfatase A-like enzyme
LTRSGNSTIQEADMAQLDDTVGSVLAYLKNNGLDDNTIVVFTAGNGAENSRGRIADRRRSPAREGPPQVGKQQHLSARLVPDPGCRSRQAERGERAAGR